MTMASLWLLAASWMAVWCVAALMRTYAARQESEYHGIVLGSAIRLWLTFVCLDAANIITL